MKTSTMGMIVGSSALASAGAVKATKGYQRKKRIMKGRNQEFSPVQEVKKGIKKGVKAGTEKTTDIIKSGIETEKEMIKGGIHKTIEGVKSGIKTQQKMMEKEKEILDRMDSAIQKKEMTMGVVVGSTALVTTGIVLALNAYQKKEETNIDQQTGSTAMRKIEGGIKTGIDKVIEGIKRGINAKQKMMDKEKEKLNDLDSAIHSKNMASEEFIPDEATVEKKDKIESPDAVKDPAYQGLTQLDAQYRDEWQANGFPQTHAELELEEDGQDDQKSGSISQKVEFMKEKLEKNNAE
jgi:hypothetical protein